ncbi:hypothetical protein CIL05_19935 [Virgibacillus profundi]|uniref:Uncharacterized protein n=1 Tax=Virgibacillus profundi TaxID=2024555 RepID=A0A2A2I735_9BACI|nr:Ger(x)C family spore germination protein [Virgibacillus profundi]PAV27821.1 hypothetical protein CIL05_19935 [Virgibacillus profundi]PXY51948.1 Ger(x)C family spore germination protein [Virgibacillus profundi]
MIKRMHKLLSCFLAVILLTGCWDVTNIEDRGFIMGIAIDLAEEGKTNGNYHLTMTNQFAVPPGLSAPGGGSGGGGKAFVNLSASGESIYAIGQEMANKINKLPFFEHLKVVIVSEEVAAIPQLFANVMDVFIRNRDARRGIKVIIAKEKAKDILNIQPENEKLPARYINQILENSIIKTGELRPVRVGEVHEHLLAKSSFVLPEVTSGDSELNFVGGSVYKGDSNMLIGSLKPSEMLGLHLITGEKLGGTIEFNFKDHLTTYSIREATSRVKVNAKDPENIDIAVTINMEGEIQETFGTFILKEPGVITALEKEISAKVKKIADEMIKKGQKELEADIFGFADNLKKFHYHTWEKIKKDWDHGENYFAKSNVSVTVDAQVRSDGVVDQSKHK